MATWYRWRARRIDARDCANAPAAAFWLAVHGLAGTAAAGERFPVPHLEGYENLTALDIIDEPFIYEIINESILHDYCRDHAVEQVERQRPLGRNSPTPPAALPIKYWSMRCVTR